MTQDKDSGAPAGRDLRLMACDSEDLAVLAAHVQDAILRVGDMIYLPRERRFVLSMKRFDWLGAVEGAPQRTQAGLHFEHVRKASLQGFRQDRPDDILYLLSLEFIPGDAPSGSVKLVFSGGCAVRLEVECLEARMADLGPRWRARHAPGHGEEGGGGKSGKSGSDPGGA
ncbi:DUF2948 family protein [Rhodoblastus sp. 17X3]|uniref:DUF2948 family protein n=1 Tax=Rhodoblastus sp. 17X3 TaxID=3047026 RepID=UPI0024B7A7AC|nr:DUF2948 family protein [Rhodoblastus sp. 17X3]MDI9848529.1 DUF2948 family protein [Rhodoblastus sp. 17X3]